MVFAGRRDRPRGRLGRGRAAPDVVARGRELGLGRRAARRVPQADRAPPLRARARARRDPLRPRLLGRRDRVRARAPEERLLCLAARAAPIRSAFRSLRSTRSTGRTPPTAACPPTAPRFTSGGSRMAEVAFQDVDKYYDGGVHAVQDLTLEAHDGEFLRARRPPAVANDGAADGCGARGHLRRHRVDRRARRQQALAQGARHRDGLPELRALSAPLRRRQHRLRAAPAQSAQGGDRETRRMGGEDARPDAVSCAPPEGAVRRPAPARGDGPRDRAPAAGVPDGRAAVEPRREVARPDARRHRTPPARPRDHDALRDARPGRGDDDG